MDKKLIYGIQQIGVGVDNAEEGFRWYATRLGADVPVFDDNNLATYMAPYMGGEAHKKRAILAMNLQGGCGYEIWQYQDRVPEKPKQAVQIGDLGITTALVKSRDIEKSFTRLKELEVKLLSNICEAPDGTKCFYIQDPYDNILRINEFSAWYADNGFDVGGTYGAILGVSDIDKAKVLYSDILGYDQLIYDKTDSFADLKDLPGGKGKFRRVLLAHKPGRKGGFSKLFGDSQIELVQSLDRKPTKIYEGRFWGDIGFIHLCFDIRNMKSLVAECKEKNLPFKVLSDEDFDMGDANGHWGYIEDPDGTLIEFVETHKVPLIEKLNLNINLRKRSPFKDLPNWMIKGMALKRVKFKD